MSYKQSIYNLSFSIGRFLGLFYKLSIVKKTIISIYYRIYSGYHSRGFQHFGKNTLLTPVRFLNGTQYISIDDNVIIGKGIILTAWNCGSKPQISIGSGTRFGENAHITSINAISIGENVLTGRNVLITDNSHGNSSDLPLGISPMNQPLYSKGSVKIGNNVWLGDNVCILPGVEIGNNCIIGANTAVSRSVPDNSVVVGGKMRIFKIS